MRVLIEHEGNVYEFVPKDGGACRACCDAHNTHICGKLASGKGNDAICNQLNEHLNPDYTDDIPQGHFKIIN